MPCHLAAFDPQAKNLVFDVLIPFYNVLNIEGTYNRFNSFVGGDISIYNLAKSKEWTLLSKLIDNKYGRIFMNAEHCFLSDAVLRNTEVLDAITETIRMERPKKYSPDNMKCLSEFYARIKRTQMQTYGMSEDLNGYEINFQYLDLLIDVLNNSSDVDFNSIYVTYDGILKSIFKNQPTKGKGVVKKIKENLPGIYMTMEPDEWNNEFPEGASFMKNEIIDKILAIIDQIQQ